MKKLTTSATVVLLTALFSVNVFATNHGTLSFDLSNQDKADAKNPYFYCTITDKTSISVPSLSNTKANFIISGDTVEFNAPGKKEIKDVSLNDVNDGYFEVTKGATQGESQVNYSTNDDSDIICEKGTGGRTKLLDKKPA